MNLCFIADLRSPIAVNWISHFVSAGHEVHLVSTSPCPAFPGAASTWALSSLPWGLRPAPAGITPATREVSKLRGSRIWNWALRAHQLLRPAKILTHAGAVRKLLAEIRPDLVHAMRIPFEGILAAASAGECPLMVSVWGNDFTLHAARESATGHLTRRTMQRCDALHSDCARDLTLSQRWGFDARKPMFLAPGNGGIRRDIFTPDGDPALPVVINPRGFRSYVRNDAFFQAIPLVLARIPRTLFVCPAMKGSAAAQSWVDRLGIGDSVRLLPAVTPESMATLFRGAQVTVSPAIHDGTPNSLLEAMACGCLPVTGDIESMREWISDGVNGLLCDPNDPASIARAIVRGLEDAGLRDRARTHNAGLIGERAEYGRTMHRVESFYETVLRARKN
ncbi:MAG TPA: glycosyltransferase family 4 protein [Candidatus Acidoferrum sp.]|nr:glycosyltransferase family 4 protein [Candidatus Acidoferrum sp.]